MDRPSDVPLSTAMTFTSGEKINFTGPETMTVSSGVKINVSSGITMKFSTNTSIIFQETGDGVISQCDWLTIIWTPPGYLIPPCSWWEVIDPRTGSLLGEFHVDQHDPPFVFHVDTVWPGPISVPVGVDLVAIKKIDIIEPCEFFEVHWPSHWYPEPCTWWEILDPETGEFTGYEFHVDWTNESCEFHIDEVIPGPYIPPFPWYEIWARKKVQVIAPCEYLVVEEPHGWWPKPCTWWEILDDQGDRTGYEFHVDWSNESCEFHIDDVYPDPFVLPFPGSSQITVEQKIVNISSCDWFVIEDPVSYVPPECSWWEILDPFGQPTGLEIHIDNSPGDGTFHVDDVLPQDPSTIPWTPPSVTLNLRRKVDRMETCNWFKVDDPALTPIPCSWWKLIHPDLGDVEFHVDDSSGEYFHVDQVLPAPVRFNPTYELMAERKIDDIQPCDWFEVLDPDGFLPTPCSWWEIVQPSAWAGGVFHVDSNNGIDKFHIDIVNGVQTQIVPPPWSVTAIPYVDPWYIKPPYPDYAPSGMPDIDQMQDGWLHQQIGWSWCGPVSVANSLWWFDSKYETNTIPPPAIIDNFPLVQSYGIWDDHDVLNVGPLVGNLAWLMDTDGQRTGIPHTGTWWWDLEAGIGQYLIQQGMDTTFEVHHMEFPDFYWIEGEIELCQDVVLLLEFWNEVPTGGWERWEADPGGEGGHYVTCAGVNSSLVELLISDPWQDAYERGWIPRGRSPVPHPSPHLPDVHNDIQYVSHDAWTAVLSASPYGMPLWELAGYCQQMGFHGGLPPTWHAFITVAIATSPLEPDVHDVAVIDVTTSKAGCLPVETVAQGATVRVNATVENQGNFAETFNVTASANATVFGGQPVSLNPGENTTITFIWNTATWAKGNYSITVAATVVPGEVDTADNSLDYGWMFVTLAGDVDADKDVDIFDIVRMASAYGLSKPHPAFDPNSDIDDDDDIDIFDIVSATANYGASW